MNQHLSYTFGLNPSNSKKYRHHKNRTLPTQTYNENVPLQLNEYPTSQEKDKLQTGDIRRSNHSSTSKVPYVNNHWSTISDQYKPTTQESSRINYKLPAQTSNNENISELRLPKPAEKLDKNSSSSFGLQLPKPGFNFNGFKHQDGTKPSDEVKYKQTDLNTSTDKSPISFEKPERPSRSKVETSHHNTNDKLKNAGSIGNQPHQKIKNETSKMEEEKALPKVNFDFGKNNSGSLKIVGFPSTIYTNQDNKVPSEKLNQKSNFSSSSYKPPSIGRKRLNKTTEFLRNNPNDKLNPHLSYTFTFNPSNAGRTGNQPPQMIKNQTSKMDREKSNHLKVLEVNKETQNPKTGSQDAPSKETAGGNKNNSLKPVRHGINDFEKSTSISFTGQPSKSRLHLNRSSKPKKYLNSTALLDLKMNKNNTSKLDFQTETVKLQPTKMKLPLGKSVTSQKSKLNVNPFKLPVIRSNFSLNKPNLSMKRKTKNGNQISTTKVKIVPAKIIENILSDRSQPLNQSPDSKNKRYRFGLHFYNLNLNNLNKPSVKRSKENANRKMKPTYINTSSGDNLVTIEKLYKSTKPQNRRSENSKRRVYNFGLNLNLPSMKTKSKGRRYGFGLQIYKPNFTTIKLNRTNNEKLNDKAVSSVSDTINHLTPGTFEISGHKADKIAPAGKSQKLKRKTYKFGLHFYKPSVNLNTFTERKNGTLNIKILEELNPTTGKPTTEKIEAVHSRKPEVSHQQSIQDPSNHKCMPLEQSQSSTTKKYRFGLHFYKPNLNIVNKTKQDLPSNEKVVGIATQKVSVKKPVKVVSQVSKRKSYEFGLHFGKPRRVLYKLSDPNNVQTQNETIDKSKLTTNETTTENVHLCLPVNELKDISSLPLDKESIERLLFIKQQYPKRKPFQYGVSFKKRQENINRPNETIHKTHINTTEGVESVDLNSSGSFAQKPGEKSKRKSYAFGIHFYIPNQNINKLRGLKNDKNESEIERDPKLRTNPLNRENIPTPENKTDKLSILSTEEKSVGQFLLINRPQKPQRKTFQFGLHFYKLSQRINKLSENTELSKEVTRESQITHVNTSWEIQIPEDKPENLSIPLNYLNSSGFSPEQAIPSKNRTYEFGLRFNKPKLSLYQLKSSRNKQTLDKPSDTLKFTTNGQISVNKTENVSTNFLDETNSSIVLEPVDQSQKAKRRQIQFGLHFYKPSLSIIKLNERSELSNSTQKVNLHPKRSNITDDIMLPENIPEKVLGSSNKLTKPINNNWTGRGSKFSWTKTQKARSKSYEFGLHLYKKGNTIKLNKNDEEETTQNKHKETLQNKNNNALNEERAHALQSVSQPASSSNIKTFAFGLHFDKLTKNLNKLSVTKNKNSNDGYLPNSNHKNSEESTETSLINEVKKSISKLVNNDGSSNHLSLSTTELNKKNRKSKWLSSRIFDPVRQKIVIKLNL